jgi:hypothetical protein
LITSNYKLENAKFETNVLKHKLVWHPEELLFEEQMSREMSLALSYLISFRQLLIKQTDHAMLGTDYT